MANYPNDTTNVVRPIDDVDDVDAASINDLCDAIDAIIDELGAVPKDTASDVADRLDSIEDGSRIALENWISPPLTNGWTNYGSGYSTAGYYKDVFGVVHLRGLIKNGTLSNAAFNLPAEYRPLQVVLLGTISDNHIGRVVISTAGSVIPQSPSTNAYVALDGLSFRP